jgi:GT2 family glycosyltransferase
MSARRVKSEPRVGITADMSRPCVSVVVPFRGDRAAAARTRDALARLTLAAGDQVILADNSDHGVAAEILGGRGRVVAADGERSSYHARNCGAAVAEADWILFIDADCEPVADLLDRYFSRPVPADCGLIAGGIVGAAERSSLLARYTDDRLFYDGERGGPGANGADEGGAAPTGNLLVRRTAFESIGGFAAGIRSAGDFDLCWRAQAAGWRLLRRPDAGVAHHHRDDLVSFLAMIARYGAGASWINRRYPGASPRWELIPGLTGSARDIAANLLGGRPTEALYRAIDAVGLVAYTIGYARSNDAR